MCLLRVTGRQDVFVQRITTAVLDTCLKFNVGLAKFDEKKFVRSCSLTKFLEINMFFVELRIDTSTNTVYNFKTV